MCQQERVYRAEEAAPRLGKSASWLSEEARLGRVPYKWMGRTRVWTDAQIAEIIALSPEVRPHLEQPTRAPSRQPAVTGKPAATALRVLAPTRPRRAVA
jgi:hypothetical protein